MNDVRLVQENGVPNIQKKLWYADDNSEISLVNFEAGDRIYSINDDELYQVEYDTSTEQEYSGEVVSFEADEDDRISSLEIEINPVQDLHGYDNPWPAGSGKNLLPITICTGLGYNSGDTQLTNPITRTELAWTQIANKLTYVTSKTYTSCGLCTNLLPAGNYVVQAKRFSEGVLRYTLYTISESLYATQLKSKSILNEEVDNITLLEPGYIFLYFNNGNTASQILEMQAQVESGSVATQWEPYENFCPISGHTGCEVVRTGKNLFGGTINQYNANNILTTGTFLKAGTYTISVNWSGTLDGLYIRSQENVSSTTYAVAYNSNVVVLTLSEDATVYIQGLKNTGVSAESMTIQLELGTTASSYKPFQGETIPVSWQTEAGTVYGGTDELVSGELVSTMVLFDPIGKTISASGVQAKARRWYVPVGAEVEASNLSQDISDMFVCSWQEVLGFNDSSTPYKFAFYSNHLYITLPLEIETASDVAAWINDNSPKFIARLVTPQTYQLDPITISTLYGQNNIWAENTNTIIKLITNNKTLFKLNPHS